MLLEQRCPPAAGSRGSAHRVYVRSLPVVRDNATVLLHKPLMSQMVLLPGCAGCALGKDYISELVLRREALEAAG